ncbi:ABCB family ABC transporter ATP-binding protein/permease [Euryhalocaulis caribicus]|uniref:ABCB family ABC transporter ATP-binding protein/permease n=1 Tax=Euryhalocaulis caribicus TaxID=1161401 RepID=UPI00039FEBEE|nr:ABC transporter ATP-binding protein/permease [Euryhalocaulis caribicus]
MANGHAPSSDTDIPSAEGGVSLAMRRLTEILLSDEMRRWRPLMALALALTVVAKLFTVASPVFFGNAINSISDGAAAAAFGGFALAIGAYAVSRWAGVGLPQARDMFFARVSQDAQRIMAVRTFGHVHGLSLRFHQTKRTGALNRIIDRGARAIDFLIRFLVFNIAPTLVELALAAGVLAIRYHWGFAVVAVATVGAYAAVTFSMTEWRVRLRRVMNDADNEASGQAVDSFVNFETVKAFAAERREAERFDGTMRVYADAAAKTQASLGVLNGAQAIVMNLGLAAMALLAGWFAIQGRLQPGDVAAVVMILMNIYAPLNVLGWAYREIKQSAVDMERMFGVLNLQPDVADREDARPLSVPQGRVAFEDVTFTHDGRSSGVKGVDMEAPPGAFIGLAGASGSGKSTLLRLLFRFYDPSSGRIVIDGQDIRDVTQESLRSRLGLVPQEVVLFNDTLRANVAYANPEADDAAIVRALERAQLGEFLRRLPDGLETRVGERGLKLSGGEKQRVGVARVILRDPAILVLDEATASLDSETEKDVQAALSEASRGRTTIAVAHRLSTIAGADRIYVLDEGALVESGTHAELIGRGGRYAAMWRRQADAGSMVDSQSDTAL